MQKQIVEGDLSVFCCCKPIKNDGAEVAMKIGKLWGNSTRYTEGMQLNDSIWP